MPPPRCLSLSRMVRGEGIVSRPPFDGRSCPIVATASAVNYRDRVQLAPGVRASLSAGRAWVVDWKSRPTTRDRVNTASVTIGATDGSRIGTRTPNPRLGDRGTKFSPNRVGTLPFPAAAKRFSLPRGRSCRGISCSHTRHRRPWLTTALASRRRRISSRNSSRTRRRVSRLYPGPWSPRCEAPTKVSTPPFGGKF